MKQIWQHVYENELCVDPQEHPILLSQNCLNPIENTMKTAEIFFDDFGVQSLFFGNKK